MCRNPTRTRALSGSERRTWTTKGLDEPRTWTNQEKRGPILQVSSVPLGLQGLAAAVQEGDGSVARSRPGSPHEWGTPATPGEGTLRASPKVW